MKLNLKKRLKLAGTLTRLGEDVSKNKIFVDDILGELERLEALIPEPTNLSPLKEEILSLRGLYAGHSAALNNMGDRIDLVAKGIENTKEVLSDSIFESEKILLKTIEELKKEIANLGSRIRSNEGGGAKNRKITIGGTDYFTRYTDLAFKAGSNVTFTVANNDQTKMVEFTITATGGGSGSGITRSINSVSVDTAAGNSTTTDYVYLVTGTHSITLPTAVGNSNLYTIKNVGTGVVTILTTGGQTIDGSASITLPVQYTSVDIESDSANWSIT